MAGLDLSGVRDWLDAEILVDTLLFTRANGAADAVLDDDNNLVQPDPEDVYNGRGAVQPLEGYSQVLDPDVQRILQTTDARYRAMLPLSTTADIRVGDNARVAAVGGENAVPGILERRFEVVEKPAVATHAVAVVVYLKQL